MMKDIYLSLGSNLGEREAYLSKAIEGIQERGATLLARSSIYETEAWGNKDLLAFYNMVIHIQWEIAPISLLESVKSIEKELGREKNALSGVNRPENYENRPIDIDILYMGDLLLERAQLSIPHPLIKERLFVLEPLLELAPDFIDPREGKSIKILHLECKDPNKVERLT